MRKSLLAIPLLVLLPLAQAAVYKWVDADGGVHYGDQPPANSQAKEVELPDFSRYAPRPVQQAGPSGQNAPISVGGRGQPPAEGGGFVGGGYSRFGILSPQHRSTVRSNPGTVVIRLQIDPPLKSGHALDFYLDGTRLMGGMRTTLATLPSVDRGEHQIWVTAVNQDGAEVARTQPVTFFMHRQSLLSPLRRPKDDGENGGGGGGDGAGGGGNPSNPPPVSGPARPGDAGAFAPRY